MEDTKEIKEDYTNEEYREKLKNIFESITDNKKLRFYYKYIGGMEKSRC